MWIAAVSIEKEAINAGWSVRELKRQIDSSLFERLLLSKGDINKETVLALAENGAEISEPADIIRDPYAVSMTVFSFDKGEKIPTHAAAGDAMVTVLDGKGRFTVGGEVYHLEKGETLIMPKDIPHAVFGEEQFNMVLVVSY